MGELTVPQVLKMIQLRILENQMDDKPEIEHSQVSYYYGRTEALSELEHDIQFHLAEEP